jgi:hypothetical protein
MTSSNAPGTPPPGVPSLDELLAGCAEDLTAPVAAGGLGDIFQRERRALPWERPWILANLHDVRKSSSACLLIRYCAPILRAFSDPSSIMLTTSASSTCR